MAATGSVYFSLLIATAACAQTDLLPTGELVRLLRMDPATMNREDKATYQRLLETNPDFDPTPRRGETEQDVRKRQSRACLKYGTVKLGHVDIPIKVLKSTSFVPCTVTKVIDGNTITIAIPDGRVVRLRLHTVDAPELDQPHGQEAKEALEKFLLGEQVCCRFVGKDYPTTTKGPSGWAVGRIHLISPGENLVMPDERATGTYDHLLATWLVKRGHAWPMSREAFEASADFPIDPRLKEWKRGGMGPEQREARRQGLGLWSQADPIAPWNWRGHKRLVEAAKPGAPAQIRHLVSERLPESHFRTLALRACQDLEVTDAVVGFYTSRQTVLGDDWTSALSRSRHGVAVVHVQAGQVVEVKIRPASQLIPQRGLSAPNRRR